MKLSPSIIFQSLLKHFEVIRTGNIKESLSLDPPVFYDGYSEYEDNRIYLGRPGELPVPGSSVSCLLICVGGYPPAGWQSRTSSLFSIPVGIDILTVFNILQETYRRFDFWNTEMLSMLESVSDYEKMIHSTSVLLNRRLTLTDRELKAIATAIPSGSIPMEFVQTFADSHRENTLHREPFFFREGQINVYCVNLFVQNEYVGNLAIQADDPPLSAGERLIFELFAHYISVAVKKSIQKNNGSLTTLRSYLIDIIRCYPVRETQLRKMLENEHLQNCSWICAAIAPEPSMNNVPAEYLCTQLENIFKTGFAVPATPYIALILPVRPLENESEMIGDMKKSLKTAGFSAGISNPFDNILKGQIYYRQAVITLETALKDNASPQIREFPEIALSYVLANTGGELPVDVLLPPELLALSKTRNSDTDYWRTLKVFLDNEMNTSQSARDLFIHRTTMMRRLEYLENAVDMSTAEKRLYLRLCIYLYEQYINI